MAKIKKLLRRWFIFVIPAVFVALFVFIVWSFTLKIPSLDSFDARKVVQSTKIYDRTGEVLLWDVHENIKRTVMPMDQISYHLKNATVAIEDSNFYKHKGIDFSGIFRSVLIDIGTVSLSQGGSTITQQLVRNAMLTQEKKISRKIKEIILALKIEKQLSKEKILELYLNEIPYGGSNYGAEAASQSYFGKSVKDLTLPEAAYLAAMVQAPTYYSPYGNHKDKLEERKNLVLKRMREIGFINEEEERAARDEKVSFVIKGDQSVKAPHFSIYVRSYLEEKYGKDVVEQDGLKVITSLDYKLQAKAEEMVAEYAKQNKENFNASNAGMVAVDPKTGHILVMVGSKDYFNMEEGGNFNITLASRQPGSSIKPFVYTTAFKKGYLPETVVFDLPTEFSALCNPDGTPKPGVKTENCYSPQNYDEKFRGPVSLRSALAQSINVPAVKVLYLAGMKDTLETAKDFGLTTLNDPDRYGLTLVLGGGEVKLLDMVGGYSVFANGGLRNPVAGILRIEDSKGNVLEEFKDNSKQVVDKNVALMITDILSDNVARTPTFGANSALYFPDRQVAVKTGTTNDSRDAWVIGYTPNFAMGVWCGNNDNTPMVKKVAGMIAAPLWHAYLEEVFKELPKEDFEKPAEVDTSGYKPIMKGEWRGGVVYKIDKISGKLATEYTPPELIEEIPIVQVHNILFWVDKNNPLGPSPQNPSQDSQFNLWEVPVRNWVAGQGIAEQNNFQIPTQYDDVHRPEYAPKLNIYEPQTNAAIAANSRLTVRFTHAGKYPLQQVDYFLNNSFVGSSYKNTYEFSFTPSSYSNTEGSATLRVIAYDEVKNRSEYSIPINLNF